MTVKIDNGAPFITTIDEFRSKFPNNAPAWLNQFRGNGIARLKELGLPTTKDEEWKYTNVSSLTQQRFQFSSQHKTFDLGALKDYLSTEEINLVFVNGFFIQELSNLNNLPTGLLIKSLADLIHNNDKEMMTFLKKNESQETDYFLSLNNALLLNGIFIRVDPKVKIDRLIHIVNIANSDDVQMMAAPRCMITVGKSAEVGVLESYVSFNQKAYLTNQATDIFLADDAKLLYCKAQAESRNAYHIGTTRVWLERDSQLHTFSLATGGLITRNNLTVSLNAEGAGAILNGLYAIAGNQHVDNHTNVDHRIAHCRSNQLYKGILAEASHAVFNGKIFVRKDAQQTNSYQLNKNLLLGKECRVDTKPQLEIFANDVKCTHGATIGQLNDDEVFYLQTRGIAKSMATKLLVRGFVDDALNTIGNPSIISKINQLLTPIFSVIN